MNLAHLRYFVTLAHTEHYTKTAEQLNITQPTLTYAINSIEEELGVKLFEKSGRRAVLTRYGKQFLGEVESILDSLDQSFEHMKEIGEGKEILRISFLSVLGIRYIPELIASYKETESGKLASFSYHNGLSEDLVNAVESGKSDIAFCSYVPDHPSLRFVPVASQELVAIVPEDHPLAGKDEIDLAELMPYPQICFNKKSGLRRIIDDLFRQTGLEPVIAMEAEEDRVIAGFAAAGFGVAVVPEMYVLDQLPVKRLKIIKPEWQRNFCMVYPENGTKSAALKHLIRYVNSRIDENGLVKIYI